MTASSATKTTRPGLGIVEPRSVELFPEGLALESGAVLAGPVTVAYETYGELSAARDNCILLCHALSGGAHAAGLHHGATRPGWWDTMVGPGKAFDTDKYFVVCSNVLGGCQGSSGPSSTNPATGAPYGIAFPFVTVRDMVRSQKLLCDHLGITRLAGVIGGSMGGMQALQWAIEYPDFVKRMIAMATTARRISDSLACSRRNRGMVWPAMTRRPSEPLLLPTG